MKSYECEIVSYMFAHGADQGTFELRATEIKGLLRFWFRTALSSKLEDNIKGLKFIESYIFGDTSQKSKVIISVDAKPSHEFKVPIQGRNFNLNGIPFPIDPIKYIAFGMYKNPRDTQWNSYVDSGTFKINVELFTSDDKEKEYIASILDNLFFLFSTFGGIGAKSDKGFGSFQIKSIKYEPDKLKLKEDINNAVENIFKNSKEIFDSKKPKDINFEAVNFKDLNSKDLPPLPSYPFLNPQEPETFGSIPLSNVKLNEALSKIGEQYYKFRREVEKDGNFKSSYKKDPSYKAKRALLGLPILYQQPRPTVTLNNSTGRKASSLHMSLKKINSNYYLFYVFLRAKICDGKLDANGTKVTPSSDFVDLHNKFRKIWGVKDE